MRSWLLALPLALCACSTGQKQYGTGDPTLSPGDPLGTDPNLPPPRTPNVIDDSGAFDLGSRGSDGGDAGGSRSDDASAPVDAGAPSNCAGALQPGDVKIVELMIASASGANDRGEWLEIQSTRACILDLSGVTITTPRGQGINTATIGQGFLLAPNASALVVDFTAPSDNHSVPAGKIAAAWSNYDVLKNGGDTITIKSGQVTIDSLTYPQFTLSYGHSVSFPADCTWNDRASWQRWSWSVNAWVPSFYGTPGSDNTDVACY